MINDQQFEMPLGELFSDKQLSFYLRDLDGIDSREKRRPFKCDD